MTDSILQTIKKMVGVSPDCDAFDLEITSDINAVFLILNQLGVGPETPFSIDTGEETWSDFIDDKTMVNMLKSYVALKVRLMFDPPSTSFVIDAISKNIQELEWRLNVQVDPLIKQDTEEGEM